jgi:hypothetical protein
MPISKKIKEQIDALEVQKDFKDLMIAILTEEDKGNFRLKATYEKLVNEYIETSNDGQQ